MELGTLFHGTTKPTHDESVRTHGYYRNSEGGPVRMDCELETPLAWAYLAGTFQPPPILLVVDTEKVKEPLRDGDRPTWFEIDSLDLGCYLVIELSGNKGEDIVNIESFVSSLS